jgi:UDP-glucuronate decarboxylase
VSKAQTDILDSDAVRCIAGIPVESLENKTILITGASGLIGTHFLYSLRNLKQNGLRINVIAIVRRMIPEYLKPLDDSKDVSFLVLDLSDLGMFKQIPSADIIIHSATYGQPGLFLSESKETIILNTVGTIALLERLHKGGHFLFLSSSEVYSGLVDLPFHEDQIGITNTTHPRACYIEAKRCGEVICNYSRTSGVHATSARLCLAYGPGVRQGDQRVLNSFIDQGLANKCIKLLDDGHAHRTYCYVADAINMLWKILLEGSSTVYNIGGISRTTIVGMAKLIGELLQVPVIISGKGDPALVGSPSDVRLDLQRYTSQFGFPHYLDLVAGVSKTIEWQRTLCRVA